MEAFLLLVNDPVVLWSILASSVGLVMIDWFFPVDWPAYLGYGLFAVFVGATIPVSPFMSLVAIFLVLLSMLVLHEMFFTRFLTNAPQFERRLETSRSGLPESDPTETRQPSGPGE